MGSYSKHKAARKAAMPDRVVQAGTKPDKRRSICRICFPVAVVVERAAHTDNNSSSKRRRISLLGSRSNRADNNKPDSPANSRKQAPGCMNL
ncbi:MAG: hypothetical protein K8F91_00365 [Candidatus Obscuribacterales bacterium]|nr:hypothetical protein [Candidatus Obscuribacterales bacterium]